MRPPFPVCDFLACWQSESCSSAARFTPLPLLLPSRKGAAKGASDWHKGLCYRQQTRFAPAFADHLYPEGQALPILSVRQHDRRVARVIEQHAVGTEQPVIYLLLIHSQRRAWLAMGKGSGQR